MYTDEAQRIHEEWINKLPIEKEEFYAFLVENAKSIQTFDLLSNISFYNHQHDAENYSDYRENRHFFASEAMALLCLKNDFVEETAIPKEEFLDRIDKIQETILNYCGRCEAIERSSQLIEDGPIAEITDKLSSEAKSIRNPGLPDHHLIFTEKLFAPIEHQIEKLFGFTIADTVKLRKIIPDFINEKCNEAIQKVKSDTKKYAKEIIGYRKTKKQQPESEFTKGQLEEYCKLPDKEIKERLLYHLSLEMFFHYSDTFTFTAQELIEFSKVNKNAVTSFLQVFSCGFPSLKEEESIYAPITILKTKPIIEHSGRYLLPSFSLLTWAVEEVVEQAIKKDNKLLEKYSDVKHEFLLNQGISFFKALLPASSLLGQNLFYNFEDKRCEVDALILYDRTLFIIEAKGIKITMKARSGHKLKTEDHLKEIVKNSYTQAIRTLDFIKNKSSAQFTSEKGVPVEIKDEEFDSVIIVSLALEPVGNIAMSLKATNEMGYFRDRYFPWIISIYDLVIIADLFKTPFELLHYLRRRENFLNTHIFSTYEELDLVGYFLHDGLYMEDTLKDAQEKQVSDVFFVSATDEINDYYRYKFGHKETVTKPPSFFIPKEFKKFLKQLDDSGLQNRSKIALIILEFNNKSIKELMQLVNQRKMQFSQDGKMHDCSIYTKDLGGLGITFICGKNRYEIANRLRLYVQYKMNQLNCKTWVAMADTSLEADQFDFQISYIFVKNELDILAYKAH